MTDAAEIGVIAGCFAGEKRVHGVMKIIAPLRGQFVSALFAGQQDSRVVQIALGYHVEVASEPFPLKLNLFLKLRQNMPCAKVVDTVNGVEPQNIDVVLFEPENRILDKKLTHRSALRAVEVDGLPPWRLIVLGEIRPELAQVISFRSKMVVNDVESDSEPVRVRGIHELLKRTGTSVTILDSKRIDAVVSPIARAGKLR